MSTIHESITTKTMTTPWCHYMWNSGDMISVSVLVLALTGAAVGSPPKLDSAPSPHAATSGSLVSQHSLLDYHRGKALHDLGRFASWGGAWITVIGISMDQRNIRNAGLACLALGIPVNGRGSELMIESARELHPGSGLEMRGWGTYLSGLALFGGGYHLFANDQVNETLGNESMPYRLGVGIASMLAGLALHPLSWYQFSKSADRARSTMDAPSAWSASPVLFDDGRSALVPGIQLAYRF